MSCDACGKEVCNLSTVESTRNSNTHCNTEDLPDSKCDLNIQNRISKGMGNITRIMNMLDKITLGRHYFKTALLLRESIFLSGLLTNAESWHGLTSIASEKVSKNASFHPN